MNNWKVESQNELFQKFAQFCLKHNIISSPQALVEKLIHRERQGNSLIAEGLALPHVESSSVANSAFIFIRLEEPLNEWNHQEDSVKGVLFLLLKKEETTENLSKIREIMKALADERVVEGLLSGNQEIMDRLF